MPSKSLPNANDGPVERGEVSAIGLAAVILAYVGLHPCEPSPRQDLPSFEPTDLVLQLDLHGLVGWAVLGFRMLAGEATMGEVVREVRRFAALAAMRRQGGHRENAADQLGVSRSRLSHWLGLGRGEPEGTRIVAVESFEAGVVRIYGRGRYAGKARPPNGTRTRFGTVTDLWPRGFFVPKLELDEGTIVWGPQCTWMTEVGFEKVRGGREVRVVPPP
jgi:hypothetical protein